MAQRVVTLLTDDLDGTEATETVTFGVDGIQYEMDLNDRNAANLRAAVREYVERARRVSGRPGAERGRRGADVPTSRTPTGVDPRTVRVWAKNRGISVKPRGRVPADLIAQFRAAGN